MRCAAKCQFSAAEVILTEMRAPAVILSIVVSCASGSFCRAQLNVLSEQERLAGWELLFDGQTAKGWRSPFSEQFPNESWAVEDECIHSIVGGRRWRDLRSSGVYKDFELSFEWKISSGGNSGVKYSVGSFLKAGVFDKGRFIGVEGEVEPGPNAIIVEPAHGFEYQLIDDQRHPDKDHPNTRSGSLYQVVGPSQEVVKPAGQFNQSRVVANGRQIEHWLNGVKVVAISLDSEEFKEAWAKTPKRMQEALPFRNQEFPVALQHHGDAVWFRSIKIRRIP